nr:(2Fe-2S)-binding protein [Nocardioides flavescens]
MHQIRLTVNGTAHDLRVPARRLLSDALRHDLALTGTHVGCEHGVCGACTVLLDGEPVRACLVFAVSVQGQEVTTVEGLTRPDGALGPVQQAFAECHGLQCGFCTPGFLTTITAGIRDNPEPTHEEAREMIAGNLCRCTGYQNIVKAVERAAVLAREGGPSEGGFETGLRPSSTTGDASVVEEVAQQPSRNHGDDVVDREDDAATTGLGA